MAVVLWDPGRTKTLTIPNAGTESDILDLGQGAAGGPKSYRRWDIVVLNAAALTGTVTVHVSNLSTANFRPLQSGGADITLPANKATPLIPLVARFLKLVSGSAEAAERAFILMGVTIENGR